MYENMKNAVVTDKELLALTQDEINIIKQYCEDEKPITVPPVLKIFDSQHQLQLVPLGQWKEFNKSAKRLQIMAQVGAEVYRECGWDPFPAVILLTTETWLKAFDPNAVPDKVRMPSDYPDAVDSIMMQSLTLAKASLLEKEPKPRSSMAILEIKHRKPYMLVEVMVEPTLCEAGPGTTELLNQFYRGWFQESMKEQN